MKKVKRLAIDGGVMYFERASGNRYGNPMPTSIWETELNNFEEWGLTRKSFEAFFGERGAEKQTMIGRQSEAGAKERRAPNLEETHEKALPTEYHREKDKGHSIDS
uniref:Uncharacterized protein n=1 Tax=Romanomermis culicivorax TaxID=13658 RepID=A0A915J8Z2_ROMCU